MVHRKRHAVVGKAADQDERIHGLPVVIGVCSKSLEIGFYFLPANRVHGCSAWHGESIIDVVHRVEFTRLITASDDKRVVIALKQLLGLGKIGDLLALVSLLILRKACGLNLA